MRGVGVVSEIIKKVTIRRFKLVFLCCLLLGCVGEPSLNTSTMDNFIASRDKARETLTYDQRILFDESSQRLVFNHLTNSSPTFMTFNKYDLARSNGEDILPHFSEIFDGMTAIQVIDADRNLKEVKGNDYIEVDSFQNIVDTIDEDANNNPLSTKVEWRGEKMTIGQLREWASNMNEKADLTLEALRLYD